MRVTFAAIAWLALAGAAVFLIYSEKQLHQDRILTRAFDVQAREAAEALSDLRAAQQAYVAAGQGIAFWMPKVSTTSDAAAKSLSSLQRAAVSGDAKSALDQATSTLKDFDSADKRARDYIKSGQELMAADVVFTEGGQLAAVTARQVEAARTAEHQALDFTEASARKIEAAAAGAAAAFAGLMLLLLAPRPGTRDAAAGATTALNLSMGNEQPATDELSLRTKDPVKPDAAIRAKAVSPVLKAAASLCTDFGRVRDVGDLNQLLARVADVMDAKGLIVWLGNDHRRGPATGPRTWVSAAKARQTADDSAIGRQCGRLRLSHREGPDRRGAPWHVAGRNRRPAPRDGWMHRRAVGRNSGWR